MVRAASGLSRLKLSSQFSTEDHKSRAVRTLKVRAAPLSAKAGPVRDVRNDYKNDCAPSPTDILAPRVLDLDGTSCNTAVL